ncbi:MAG: hypothetical protein WBV11_13595, partial [Salegentibacter sp.]
MLLFHFGINDKLNYRKSDQKGQDIQDNTIVIRNHFVFAHLLQNNCYEKICLNPHQYSINY